MIDAYFAVARSEEDALESVLRHNTLKEAIQVLDKQRDRQRRKAKVTRPWHVYKVVRTSDEVMLPVEAAK